METDRRQAFRGADRRLKLRGTGFRRRHGGRRALVLQRRWLQPAPLGAACGGAVRGETRRRWFGLLLQSTSSRFPLRKAVSGGALAPGILVTLFKSTARSSGAAMSGRRRAVNAGFPPAALPLLLHRLRWFWYIRRRRSKVR
nr:hypothetical protein Iba_chr08eCG6390 [Ipomoea batatas]